MKATSAIGVVCLLLCGTILCGQQAERPVLRASADNGSSELSNILPSSSSPTAHFSSAMPSESVAIQVATGNAWVRPASWQSPISPATSGNCTQVTVASLTETPGGGLSLHDFSVHGEFTRDHMIMMARNFIPGQPLPDAPSYKPMTSKEKFEGWAHHTYSADMLVGTVFDALILQATGGYRDYGGGMGGFSKRYGTALLSNEAGSLFGRWLFPTLLHQDPRYFPSRQTNVFDRMAYAASRTLITRSDDGRNVFNSSLVLTLLFTSALANGYKPNYDESFQATLANSAAGLGATAQVNLLNEFWPDIKSFFSHHEPGASKEVRKKVTDLSFAKDPKR
jgi:hypothetical protein